MKKAVQTTLVNKEELERTPKLVLDSIRKAPWRRSPYKYQNWGNWLHRMSAYVGKINPAMAHWLVTYSSKPGQIILDPFCGVGTVPLEADLLGRVGIGVDLNPYPFTVARAKFDRAPLEQHLNWLDSLAVDTSEVDLNSVPASVLKYYHPSTLREILLIRDMVVRQNKHFLLGCLLGIVHGHRPGHLSATTSLVIPYEPRTKPQYRWVIPRLKEKARRMYRSGFSLQTKSTVYCADARALPLESESVDLVVSSPPYYNTLDYVGDNWLRLEFLGINEEKREELKDRLIQDRSTYLGEMKRVGFELRRVTKRNGYCIFILGDSASGKKVVNTAEEVKNVYEGIGFICHGIVDDAMPVNKCVPSSYKREKLDRILIMTRAE